ncbi:MAG: aminotransferase class III-fold pyridoxal phosphate-dependent enzyme, partial [Candidatus Hydrogenedentes bacterium]|nr:aminotransferase class III-fold pyridoxal phosphate-dependent enzyme [Candidatus Hydrogenedentota bacterium]
MHPDAQRSHAVFPGGSNGEFNLTPDLSMVIQRGSGCELWDSTGKRYLDFSMGWGSVLVGHGHPGVVEAVQQQAPLGANFAYVNENSLALAEEILRLSPACDRLRFCASGTEATMYCQRLARAFTGRDKILKFEGAYHGANEIGVTSLFPSDMRPFPQPDPSSAGIDAMVRDTVLVAPFNDAATTADIVDRHRSELAAIIVEPLHRCLPPQAGFLGTLRELCNDTGALLIFDEVVTGFRLAYGGAQDYYGVIPDLVAYGKALGGGYPIGAFGGRAEIMALVQEDRLNHDTYVWTASTLGGNPISTAAALAALAEYRKPESYPRLHTLGAYFRAGLARVLKDAGQEGIVLGDGPLAQIAFTNTPI